MSARCHTCRQPADQDSTPVWSNRYDGWLRIFCQRCYVELVVGFFR